MQKGTAASIGNLKEGQPVDSHSWCIEHRQPTCKTVRPAARYCGQGICVGKESKNGKKQSKRRGHHRKAVGYQLGLDLGLVHVCIQPLSQTGTALKRRDRLLKRCLLPNWRTRRTGRARMGRQGGILAPDGPCSWAVFCFFFGMHVSAPDAYARSAVRGCLSVQGSWGRSPRFGSPAHRTVAAESQARSPAPIG